jgi:hypothetical protein
MPHSAKKSNKAGEIAFSFDDLLGGLKDALAHAKRKLALKATTLTSLAPTAVRRSRVPRKC